MALERSFIKYSATNVYLWTQYEYSSGRISVEGHLQNYVRALFGRVSDSFEVLITDDDVDFGTIYDSRNGTGMIGYILRNESDFGLFYLSPNYDDIQYLSYTAVVYLQPWYVVSSGFKMFTDKDSVVATFSVLEFPVWMLCFASMFVLAVVQSVRIQVKRNIISKFKGRPLKFTKCASLSVEAFFEAYAILFNQTSSMINQVSKNSFWIFWIWASYILTSVFSSGILSRLYAQREMNRIETLKDLYEHPKLNILIPANSPFHYQLKNSVEEIPRAIYENIISTKGLKSVTEIDIAYEIELLRRGITAAILPQSTIVELLPLFTECQQELYISKLSVYDETLAFPMNKLVNVQLKSRLERLSLTFFESGMFQTSNRMDIWKAKRCLLDLNQESGNLKVLKFDSLRSSFGFLLIGIVGAIFWELLLSLFR